MTTDRFIPFQRRNEILEQLEKNQFVRSVELSKILNASEATIRRDLTILEEEGLIERTYGGAMISRRIQSEPEYFTSTLSHAAEKEAIGMAAAQLVRSGEVVFLNFGTTTTQVARFLKNRADLKDVTIVTNNISALLEFQNTHAFQVICLGGSYRPLAQSLVGSVTVRALEGILAARAIIGVDGVSPRYGCTTPVESDAEISRKMIENTTDEIILVADSSKWGVVSSFRIAPLQRFNNWLTDTALPQDALEIAAEASMNVTLCPTAAPLLEKNNRILQSRNPGRPDAP